MQSNIFSKISLCLLALIASVSIYPMGGYYEPDPKAVTIEEKLNHYLFYLAAHGITSMSQLGPKKAFPLLVERAAVDGARVFIPELFGIENPNQKRLINLGIEGTRQAIRFSGQAKEYAEKQGKNMKRSEAIKLFFVKKFIPSLVKSLVVDLIYFSSGHFANSVLQQAGYNPAVLTASPYIIPGMLYQQARASGYGVCSSVYDVLFGSA